MIAFRRAAAPAMSLVESVARAIAVADLMPSSMMSLSDLESQGYIAMAKAAIEAMEGNHDNRP